MFEFFEKILAYFTARQVPYMLSGSIAMGLYVVPRATRGIDFVIHLQAKDIESFVAHFSGAYYCSKEAVIDAVDRKSMFNVLGHASGFKADFVIRKDNEYRLAEFERIQLMDFYGLKIYVVSKEDLLLSKLIWIQQFQSAIQMEDIKNLSLIPQMEWKYVNHWIEKLSLDTFKLFT